MDYEIPDNYRLGKIAHNIAERMGIELLKAEAAYDNFYKTILELPNKTDHLLSFIMNRGKVNNELMLNGVTDDNKYFHYGGAISETSDRPIEALYINDSKKILTITWGLPTDTGVIDILDLQGSTTLQNLSQIGNELGGRKNIFYRSGAPAPSNYQGTAQFQEEKFDMIEDAALELLGIPKEITS
jgi:hypothetical protein